MKAQRIGVCTFLPLDSLKVKPPAESFRKLGGSTKLIVDVIVCDEMYVRSSVLP